jgi:hypothetical protein
VESRIRKPTVMADSGSVAVEARPPQTRGVPAEAAVETRRTARRSSVVFFMV